MKNDLGLRRVLFIRLLSAFLTVLMAFSSIPSSTALADWCSHKNIELAVTYDWFEPISDTEHMGYYVDFWYCNDCFNYPYNKEYSHTSPHCYAIDEKTGLTDYSKCTACGYENMAACIHIRTNEKISSPFFDLSKEDNVSASGHILTRTLEVYCDNCGVLVSSSIYDEQTESHSYNNNGKCNVCGYSMPEELCDHSLRYVPLSSQLIARVDSTHKKIENARLFCLCGKENYTSESFKISACSFTSDTVIQPEHKEEGHLLLYTCACGNLGDEAGFVFYYKGCKTCLAAYGFDPLMMNSQFSERAQELQKKLYELGYFNFVCNGLFGQDTHDALVAFQHDYNLPETGILSPDTANMLSKALLDEPIRQSSDYSDRAKELQEKLSLLGYLNSACDGLFGPKTVKAVKAFQLDHNLPETGVVYPVTMKAIDDAVSLLQPTAIPEATRYRESTNQDTYEYWGTPISEREGDKKSISSTTPTPTSTHEPLVTPKQTATSEATATPEPTATPAETEDDNFVLWVDHEGYNEANDTLHLTIGEIIPLYALNTRTGEKSPVLFGSVCDALQYDDFILSHYDQISITEADRIGTIKGFTQEGTLFMDDLRVIGHKPVMEGRYLLSAESAGYRAAEDTLYIEEYESVGLIVIDVQTGEHLSLKDIPGAHLRVLPGGSITGLRYTAGDCGEAQIILECDGVLQDIMTVRVLNFHQFVHSLASLYDEYHKVSEYHNYYEYYYEASDLKYEFDDQFFNHDLDYNTHADSRTDYEQQARELYLYTLSQNIQEKKTEMLAMTKEERAAYFPGVMYDPAQGAWKVGQQAVYAQALADEELDAAIDHEIADMFELALNASMETCLFFSGSEDDTPKVIAELVTKTVNTVCRLSKKPLCWTAK